MSTLVFKKNLYLWTVYPTNYVGENKLAWSLNCRDRDFSALSAIGAMIPIPSPVGSIALDSFPGYFMALWRGVGGGATVCAIGHLLSAFRAGFPLGYLHLAVSLLMAGVGVLIAVLNRRFGIIIGLAGGVALNTIGGVLAVPVYGWGIVPVITPFLFVASTINAAMAGITYKSFKKLKLS